jgi:hypothetical protein
MSDQQVPVAPGNLISPLPVHWYHTLRSGSQEEKQKSRQPMYYSEVQGGFFFSVRSSSKWHIVLWTLKSMGHGILG